MPIFEYKCRDCGEVTELLEIGGGKKERACGKCGGKELDKMFSTFSGRVKEPPASAKCQGCPSGGSCPHNQ